MDIDEIIELLEEDVSIREELIYWLSENGYLDNFKIDGVSYDDGDY